MENEPKKPVVRYRVQIEKRLEINKSYKERRNRAAALRILSYGLFGQKRFQNLYLSCSLNCFYWALQIASMLHRRVAGLAMIIKFEEVRVIEYYESGYADKKYTKILIKLTKDPTEEDKKEAGYNPGFASIDIKDPLTQILGRRQGAKREGGQRGPRRNQRRNDDRRDRGDRGYRGDRGDREDRRDRGDQQGRRDKKDYDQRPRNKARDDRDDENGRKNRGGRRQRDEFRESKPRNRYEEDNKRVTRYDDGGRDREDKRYKDDRQDRDDRRDRGERKDRDERRDRDERKDRDEHKDRDERKDQRGAPRTRGGAHQTGGDREKRYEAKQPDNDRKREGQERGDRRPPRYNRYSDDED